MGPVLSVSAFPALVTALLYPLLRRRFLVRFDAAGVTVVRPLGRRNVPWPDVAGFCFALSDGDSESWQIRISRTAAAPTGRLVHVLAEFAGSRVDERRTAVHGALFRQFALRGLGLVEDPWPEQWQRDHVARALGEAGRGEGIG
nr:PH domain-containing protein [Streptomyces sp. SID13726]